MTKAYSVLNVKSVDDSGDERIIKGIASTPTADRDNDIMEPKGAKFSLPFPFLWQHDHNQPIGEVTEATITDNGIEVTIKIAKIEDVGELKTRIDTAWQTLKSGLVKCLSIGFKINEYNYLEDSWGLHIKEWEWYELSAVTIPANPDAVITDVKQIKKAFASADRKSHPKNPSHPIPQKTSDTDAPAPVSQPQNDYVVLVDPNAGSIPLITGELL